MRKNVAGQKVTFSLFKNGARINNPTIAVADFKVDLDGAGQANVATLPTSDAAGLVTWLPTQAETNGNVVTFLALDALGDQWEPLTISFDTAAETAIITNLDAAVSTRSTLAQADILSDATPFAGGNVDAAISTRGTANAGDAMALTGVALTDIEDAVWDTPIVDHLDAGSTGEALNAIGVVAFPAGAISYTYTVTNSVTTLPVEGVDIWVSTDLAGTNIIWRGTTDAFGVARDVNNNLPALDAGTYYFWKQKSGFVTTNPDPEVVV